MLLAVRERFLVDDDLVYLDRLDFTTERHLLRGLTEAASARHGNIVT